MNKVSRVLSNLNMILAAMLLFLVLFQSKMSLPSIVQAIGRMHPLVLHLPIGILIFSFLIWCFRSQIETTFFQSIFGFSLSLIAFTSLLTSLMGLFLSREDGYNSDTLYWHRLLSLLLSFGSYAFMLWYQSRLANKHWIPGFMIALLALLVTGSHQGAKLTHGEGFILKPLQKNAVARPTINDESSLYLASIEPLFQSKCMSCHNPQKAKGGLDLTSEVGILKGGKQGPVWIAGDTNSRILQNIFLPFEDKKHMPPEGKPQLTIDEKILLKQWILSGADLKKRIKDYESSDTLLKLATPYIHKDNNKIKTYTFAPADPSLIQKLNDPFCAVFPMDQNTPALQVYFFVREKYNPSKLQELLKIKDQIVVLNMDNMPVTDVDLTTIARFSNVEKLLLNHSSITNTGIETIANLPSLTSLAISGTNVDATILPLLLKSPVLREVFIWNTKIIPGDLQSLEADSNKISFNLGYIPDPNEVLPLTPPIKINESEILKAKDSVGLKHQIRGVTIRYTLDGSIPDSAAAPIYSSPLPIINGFTLVRARAVKPGWLSSPVIDFTFFKQGVQALKAELITKPNVKYQTRGAHILIDGKKGPSGNFNDDAWIGYREQPFSALFQLDTAQLVHNISISIYKNVSAFILPPAEVNVYAGQHPSTLKWIKRVTPPVLTKDELRVVKNDGINIALGSVTYPYYRIEAKPVSKLPAWHPGKGEKAWIFVDEVFFN